MELMYMGIGFLFCLACVSFAMNRMTKKALDMMNEANTRLDMANAAYDRASGYLDRADKRWKQIQDILS